MMNVSDNMLLREFACGENPMAFNELAARHSDWVYSAALRMVRDAHLAEDVTQAAFLLLAQNAAKLGNRPINAWLFKVTRHCAANALRTDRRRRLHERTAAMLKSDSMDAEVQPIWEQAAPLLEESIGRLRSEDRQALLLRFYQRKSMTEVGAVLGVSEDTAQKRVAKAVEKLRSFMSGKGLLLPAVAVAMTLLFDQTTHAAPMGLSARCIPGAASTDAVQIAQGVHKMLLLSKLKLFAAVVLVLTAVPLGLWSAFGAVGSDQTTISNQTAAPLSAIAPAPAGSIPLQIQSPAKDDAAIALFCNSHTQLVISLDLANIDPDALANWLQTNLLAFTNPADANGRQAVVGHVAALHAYLKQSMNLLAQAGCQREYLLAMQRGKDPENIVGMFAFAVNSETSTARLDKIFMRRGEPPVDSPDGNARLYAAKPDSEYVMTLASEHSVMIDALSATGCGAIRVAFNPAVLKYSGPLPGIMGLGSLSEPEWRNVVWGSATVFPPPNTSATIILQCQDVDSAVALVKLIDKRFAQIQNPSATQEIASDAARNESDVPLIQKMMTQLAPLLAKIKPTVVGDRVIATFDKPTTDLLMTIWYQCSFYEEGRRSVNTD